MMLDHFRHILACHGQVARGTKRKGPQEVEEKEVIDEIEEEKGRKEED